MRILRTFFLLFTLSLIIVNCSTDGFDAPPEIQTREGNCFDGILNGDEVIFDCGGECPGFCPPNSIGVLGGEVRGIPLEQNQVAPLQLNPEIEYRLIGPLVVRDRATLSIPVLTIM